MIANGRNSNDIETVEQIRRAYICCIKLIELIYVASDDRVEIFKKLRIFWDPR